MYPGLRARFLGLALAASAAMATAIAAAMAQESPDGIGLASAIAYGEIPAGAEFDTLAADSSDLDAEALQRVNRELANRGHGASRDAALVMLVDMTLIRAEGQDERTLVPRTGTEAPLGEGDNLFSSERSTLLNQREIPRSGHLLRLDIAVYERKSGLYLWRGRVSRDGLDVKVEQAAQRMVSTLLEHLGETLAESEISLQ